MEIRDVPLIYQREYWNSIKRCIVDIEIGKERQVDKEIQDEDLEERFIKKFNMKENSIIAYSDGSKEKEKASVGVGVVIDRISVEKGISINKLCSIYSAEIKAIYEIIAMAVNEKWDTDLLILTDNQSVCKELRSCNTNIRTHEGIIEIKRKIKEYKEMDREIEGRDKKVGIGWIPGHMGILGNERADGIAKNATNKSPKEEYNKLPYSDWKGVHRNKCT